MSLFIKGMTLPEKFNLYNVIFVNRGHGEFSAGIRDGCRDIKDIRWHEVVEVKEPHGRLIDADELDWHDISPVYGMCVIGVTEEDIAFAETVIEAERKGKERWQDADHAEQRSDGSK